MESREIRLKSSSHKLLSKKTRVGKAKINAKQRVINFSFFTQLKVIFHNLMTFYGLIN